MSSSANPPKTISRAQALRRNMTEGEKKLWRELREFKRLHGIHVRRQAPIGQYVADFAILSVKLIVEVDGEHHFTADGMARDARRDAWFSSQGFVTVRFNTGDLDELTACVETILRHPRIAAMTG
jgi:very-short-patch-repair endonuclease